MEPRTGPRTQAAGRAGERPSFLATANSGASSNCSTWGNSPRPSGSSPGSPRSAGRADGGSGAGITWPSASISRRSTSNALESFGTPQLRIPRDRVSRAARRPRVRDRTALARPARSPCTRRDGTVPDRPNQRSAARRQRRETGACQALEYVYQNDPAGPPADAAFIRVADYYMKQQEYDSAAAYYDTVVREYRWSPFRMRARLAAIEARIRSHHEPLRLVAILMLGGALFWVIRRARKRRGPAAAIRRGGAVFRTIGE